MSVKRWKLNKVNEECAKLISSSLGISPLAAKVLVGRGFDTVESAKGFLECGRCCEDPYQLKDMDRAAERIKKAIYGDELIAIFGDYDADGLTATTLMYRCLSSLGARVVCSLPSREGTGYGLSRDVIDSFKQYGVSLIVTVDNGISAFAEVEYANSIGIDTVVTDHHVTRGEFPAAVAVVNPHREDDESFSELAGVGVALKVAAALEECSVSEAIEEYGLLAAIGTVGDIMPLYGENRYIVSRGISQFADCDNPGIIALCEEVGIDLANADEGNIAYLLAPRLNAAGRMGSAERSLELLLCDDYDHAKQLAHEIEQLNSDRRAAEQEATERITALLSEDTSQLASPFVFVYGDCFHPGVVGIVCSRLVERYNKPVIIVSVDGDCAKGSGRSVGGFSLYNMIDACGDLLEKYGGHDAAAGFTLKTENLEKLRERMLKYCEEKADEYSLPVIEVDACIGMREIDEDAVAGLRVLAPYGRENREPVFWLKDMEITGLWPLGDRHTRLGLRKDGKQIYAAYFGTTPQELGYSVGEHIDVIVNLTIYTNSNNRACVSVKAIDLRVARFTWDDLMSYEEYGRFCFTRKIGENSYLRSTREDAAIVYRVLRTRDVPATLDASLAGCFGNLPIGKVLALVRVFVELNLAKVFIKDGKCYIAACPSQEKRDLRDSAIYRAISGEQ